MITMPSHKVLTEAETQQITKALTAGIGKPPSGRELTIALEWASFIVVSWTLFTGVRSGQFTMAIRGDEPVFDLSDIERIRRLTEERQRNPQEKVP